MHMHMCQDGFRLPLAPLKPLLPLAPFPDKTVNHIAKLAPWSPAPRSPANHRSLPPPDRRGFPPGLTFNFQPSNLQPSKHCYNFHIRKD